MHRPYLNLEKEGIHRPLSPFQHRLPTSDGVNAPAGRPQSVLNKLRCTSPVARRPLTFGNHPLTTPLAHPVLSMLSGIEKQACDWLAGDHRQLPANLFILLTSASRRIEIVRVLGSYLPGDPRILAADAVHILLLLVRDRDIEMRSEAVKALANVVAVGSRPTVVPQIVDALAGNSVIQLLHSGNSLIRQNAVEAFGQLAASPFQNAALFSINILTSPELCFLLHDNNLNLRSYLIRLLGTTVLSNSQLVAKKATNCLLEPTSRLILDDLDEPARHAMIEALAKIVIFCLGAERQLASEYLVAASVESLLSSIRGPGPGGLVIVNALKQIREYSDSDFLARNAGWILEATCPDYVETKRRLWEESTALGKF